MNTDEARQREVDSTEVTGLAREKRKWIAPALIPEDARYATQAKISNPLEGVFSATPEGAS